MRLRQVLHPHQINLFILSQPGSSSPKISTQSRYRRKEVSQKKWKRPNQFQMQPFLSGLTPFHFPPEIEFPLTTKIVLEFVLRYYFWFLGF